MPCGNRTPNDIPAKKSSNTGGKTKESGRENPSTRIVLGHAIAATCVCILIPWRCRIERDEFDQRGHRITSTHSEDDL
jgi:hypothetical protein